MLVILYATLAAIIVLACASMGVCLAHGGEVDAYAKMRKHA